MNNKTEILDELSAIGPALIPLQGLCVFNVPESYFAQFPDNLLEKVNKPIALQNNIASPFSVPQGYFNNLAETIMGKVAREEDSAEVEIKKLSPALSATGNDNVFKVPSYYFTNLAGSIVAQVQTPAKVVKMKPRSLFVRYAAAAVITGILGLSTFSFFNNRSSNLIVADNTAIVATGQQIIASSSFDKILETVSAEEIEQYLTKQGEDVKAALVASSIDSKDLPAADDYLFNENTLNNYLKSLQIQYDN